LESGTRLGSFVVIAQIGAGGMGEVYRARDSRLNRDVALKVLPHSVAADADRLARLKREAQALASLSHPNIGHIYGIEDTNGISALVLELVEGPTLAEHIERSPQGTIPVEEALALAAQIADALDTAHERGIVHRDLKPANIKITPAGVVKVLDFGLAKTAGPVDQALSDASQSPTIDVGGTREGMLVGTLTYMSPEQARGQAVDKRTDVWAFGCVLYEMLTGRAPFARDTMSDTLAAILEHKPDWEKLPKATPAAVRRLLERCLTKPQRQRLRDLGDAQLEIADALAAPTASMAPQTKVSSARTSVWWAAALVGTIIVTSAAVWRLKPQPAIPAGYGLTARLAVIPTAGDQVAVDAGAIALSPDGHRLAYVAGRGGRQQIYIRDFDQFDSKAVPGTEGGYNPFFSPDAKWLGFFAGGKLRKVLLGAGQPVTISEAAIAGSGSPSWESDDTILFAPIIASSIMRVPAAGGIPTAVTKLAADESAHQWPQLLPGGKALIYSALSSAGSQIYAQSIGTGERRLLVQGLGARYLPSGHLVFIQGGTVMAAPFDPVRLEMTGSPVVVMTGVLQAARLRSTGSSNSLPHISFASTGATLAYVPANTGRRRNELVIVDRSGVERPTGASGGEYFQPRLSPDGRRVAVTVGGDHDDVWLFDLSRQTWSRFTSEGNNSFPVWAPDGTRLTYVSDKAGVETPYTRRLDSSTDERLLVSDRASYPLSMSRDGTLAFVSVKMGQAQDIWILHPDRKAKPTPWLETAFSEGAPTFSPDGRWLAYVSNDSGRNEIYVRPYPGPGEKITISIDGANEPVWTRGGRELFYRNGDQIFAVDVSTLPALGAGKARKILERDYERTSTLWPNFDVSADGQQFLMVKTLQDDAPAYVAAVLNWDTELKRLVPITQPR
jgi:Tol biopolymer transport system component